MSVTSQNYLVHWQSHADYRAAWDYINSDLGMENYVKIYTSHNFNMHPDLEEEPTRTRLDFLINQMAITDQRYARWGIRSLDITP